MNNYQIECFLTVSKYMNFSRAAEVLYISQPAVSRHISNLENELHTRLFNRTEKPLTFTAAGREWYTFFLRVTGEFKQLQTDLQVNGQQNSCRITFSIASTWDFNDYLKECFGRFSLRHPSLEISRLRSLPPNIRSMIPEQSEPADVIFHLMKSLKGITDYQSIQLGEISNTIFYSVNSPLAKLSELTFENFVDATFLYIRDNDGDDSNISQADICTKIEMLFLKNCGQRPKLQAVKNPEVALSMVEDGFGVMLRDEWARIRANPKLRTFSLKEKEPIGLAWKRHNRSEAVRLFVNEVVDYFQRYPIQ